LDAWLKEQPNVSTLYVEYNRLLAEPQASIDKIAGFLDVSLDTEKMAGVVDPSLYRQRK
jgi:hypothetical protein